MIAQQTEQKLFSEVKLGDVVNYGSLTGLKTVVYPPRLVDGRLIVTVRSKTGWIFDLDITECNPIVEVIG
jgi:hypothetical protein